LKTKAEPGEMPVLTRPLEEERKEELPKEPEMPPITRQEIKPEEDK